MKKWEFRGSRHDLQKIVKKLNGVMDTVSTFHCIYHVQDVSRPSGISFRFDCDIFEYGMGLTIHCRVRPTVGTLFLPAILLLLLIACIVAAAVFAESWIYSGIFTALFLASVVILLTFQKKCTQRFLRAFEKTNALPKHIR